MKNYTLALADQLVTYKAPGSRMLNLGNYLKSKEKRVEFFSFSSKDKICKNGISVVAENNFFSRVLSNYKLAKLVVNSAIKNNSIVIVRGMFLMFFITILSFPRKVTLVVDLHCKFDALLEWIFDKKYFHAFLFGPISILNIIRADYLLCITEDISNYHKSFFNKKTFLIPNGVSSALVDEQISKNYSHSMFNEKDKYILFIGHQEPWVPLETFLKASQEMDDYKFAVIGESSRFEDYTLKYPNVLFTGSLPFYDTINIAKKYAFCFYHPFLKNDIWKYKSSRKLLEYLYIGKPIVINTAKYVGYEMKKLPNFFEYRYKDVDSLISTIKGINEDYKEYELADANQFSWDNILDKSGIVEVLV